MTIELLSKRQIWLAVDNQPGIAHWLVAVRDGLGRQHDLSFDHDPSDDELALQLPAPPRRLAPTSATSKAGLKLLLDAQLQDAQAWDWFNTKVQADGSVPIAAKTAVANRADAEYTEAKRLANEWRQAT